MEGLTTSYRTLNEIQADIRGTLELILERLNAIERRSTRVPYLNCDEIGRCVRNIDCECAICVGSDITCPGSAGCCARSIDCECGICIGSDTSTGSEGLNCDEAEVNRSSDFHALEDPQVELDSLVLGCTQELDLSSLCFNTLLECVEIKKTRVASYLFDKMSERDLVQVVTIFMVSNNKFSLVLVGKGLVVPIWDPGISLKTLKLVGHTNNVREILMDMTSMFCLHRSSANINRLCDTGWQWFMHLSIVHIDSVCSGAIIPTSSRVYSSKEDLSAFQSLEDPKVEFDSFVIVVSKEKHIPRTYRHCMISGNMILPGNLLDVQIDIGTSLFTTTCSMSMFPVGQGNWHGFPFDPGSNMLIITNSNSLLDCYTKCLRTECAVQLIVTTPHKIVVSWMIYCYARDLWCHEVVSVFSGCLGVIQTNTVELMVLLGWCTSESFLQPDAQAVHRYLCEKVEKLMRVEFSEFRYDSSGSILKYYILVEKVKFARCLITTSRVEVVRRHILSANTNCSSSLRDGAATVKPIVYGLYFTFNPGGIMNVLENQAVGLHFQKMQHLKILHQHTCSFTGYATSFFFIPSWRPAYGSKFSSNIVHIVYLLAEELALHFLNKQVHNFCWSMLNINEVEYCLHAMELYYLIATTPETRGLPHQFEFDPGISFLKKCCYLSDYKCNFDMSTSDGSLPLVEPNFFSVNNFDPPKIVASSLSFYTVLDLPTSEDSHLQKAPPRLLVNGYMVSKEKRIHMKKATYVSQITVMDDKNIALLCLVFGGSDFRLYS